MDKNKYSVLRKKILAIMLIVPLIPFALLMIIGYHYFTDSVESLTIAKIRRIVEDHKHIIDLFLSERKSDLQFVMDSHVYTELSDPLMLKIAFDNLQKKSIAFVDIGVFNKDGMHVSYVGPFELVGKNYKDAKWFREVSEKGYYISDIFLGYRQMPHFVIAIAKIDGGEGWIIRATIDSRIFNELVEKVRIGKTGEAYLINKSGHFQTERRSGGALMGKDADADKYLSTNDEFKTFIQDDSAGVPFLYATTWLKNKDWLLIVRQEKSDAFQALRSAGSIAILIAVLGGVLIVGMAFAMTSRIIKRMELMDQEKGELSQQLIVASRLAEIGEMSAGFAHEINNPLQIIRAEQTLIETIMSELEERGDLNNSSDLDEIKDSLGQIRVQIDRCASITQALLKFARKKEPVTTMVDLHKFIPSVIEMVKKKASVDGISIETVFNGATPPISSDEGQLQQVLVNLLNNAIDAIIDKKSSENGLIKVLLSSKNNDSVEISVQDNGSGITQENMEKIFTPFFTTKPVGKGTGLGLPVCYGIIDKMGGLMEVSSELGKGTTFTIRLPKSL